MDVLSISDFDKLCRCCLYTPVAKPLRQMVPMNDWHLGVYCAITSLKYNAEDALPKLICHQCNSKIRTIQNFADVCQKSNDWLNARLKTIKNKTVSLKVENKEQLVENSTQIVTIINSEDTQDTLKEVKVNERNETVINAKKDHITSKNDTVRKKSLNKTKNKTVLPPKEENVEQLVNNLIEIVTVSESEGEDDTKNIANEIQVNSEEVIDTINDSMTITSNEDDAEVHLNEIQSNSEQLIKADNDLITKTNEEQVYRWQIPLNSCYTCKIKFATAALRDKHYKESVTCKPRQFPCRKCGKSFGRGSSLIAHQAVHSEERNYSCSKCGRTFKQRCAMTWHEKLVHNKDKALKFNCQFCARRFPQPGLLKEHELIHTDPLARKLKRKYKNKKQYFQKCICPICGKVLCSKYILPEHLRTHTGERPLKCTHCPKTFRTHQSLKIHTNIHLGIRPFSCELCDKSFSQQQSLKAHMLVHTGEKPYQCDICAKRFRSRVNLRLHMTIHTGDKPLKCPHCDERFADYKIRRTHIQKFHRVSTSKKASNEQDESS